jgi:DNA-directed DNA polymerase III PolC
VLPFDQFTAQATGLICLTGGRHGLATSLLTSGSAHATKNWLGILADLFPGRLYVELQRHTPEDAAWTVELARTATRQRLPLVATHQVAYLHPEEGHLQKVVTAIRKNTPLAEIPATAAAPPEAYFLSPDEMRQRFSDLPRALAAQDEIAARCSLELPLGELHFPEVELPAGETPLSLLRQHAEAGARRIYAASPVSSGEELSQEIRHRLDHELATIDQCGYTNLFLIVEEILAYAKKQGVPVSSRGSAASSLVAHCLGITSPDPLRLNLYFERFLNPARATPPDIDTDLCSRRRDSVIQFVYERFGQERVAMVCTVNRFRRRSALREVAKAYGLPPDEVTALADSLPSRWYGPPRNQPEGAPYADIAERFREPTYQAIFETAAALLGKPHHLSIHPGGILIAPGNLTDLAPTQVAAKGIRITQFDLDSIEQLGLVKIDLLGIRGLTVLGDVAESLYATLPDPPATPIDALEAIPDGDPLTADLVRRAQTIGCFQIESPGMRSTLKEIQADSVDDLMVALALYRPGPLTGGLKDAFIRRHRGQEVTSHLHPSLAPLLADTYGVILYQEQVLRIAHELAGLSLADADLLRRAMSHFDPGKQMQTLKEKFIAGAYQRNQVPEATSERIWELMAAFAGYGFPKAHAASYAQVAWRAAWCKVHYPAVFMAAVLANWGGYYSQRVYLTEARRMGLALYPPLVNYARAQFSVRLIDGKPNLFMGLDQVRDLTRRTLKRIVEGQPFLSLDDFLGRADPRPVEAENLARSGSLAGFGTIPAVLNRLQRRGWQGGQLALFDLDAAPQEEWSLAKRAAAQDELLGVSIVAHPLELAADQISSSAAVSTLEAAGRIGQRLRVAGMRQIWRRSAGRGGDTIYFMSLEDLEGMLEVVISAEVYRRSKAELVGAGPFIVEGSLEIDTVQGEPYLRAERIWRVAPAES